MYKCTLFDNWCNRQYGDWVALDAAEGSFKGATPDEVVCYAYEYYSTTLFAKMCGIIGRNAESEKYFGRCYKKYAVIIGLDVFLHRIKLSLSGLTR